MMNATERLNGTWTVTRTEAPEFVDGRVRRCVQGAWQESELIPHASEELAWSNDGRFVWVLGMQDGCAVVTLLHGENLAVVGTHRPVRGSGLAEGETVPLEGWGDDLLVTATSTGALVACSNAGDDPLLVFCLHAGAAGIKDPVGARLYDVALSLLDECIHGAFLLSPERIVILGDISDATVLRWPELDVVGELPFEGDESDDDDGDDAARLGEGGGVQDGVLLMNVVDDDGGLLHLLAYDAASLEPLGRVVPPSEEGLVVGEVFVGDDGTRWTFERR
jgi:hypothetical protein